MRDAHGLVVEVPATFRIAPRFPFSVNLEEGCRRHRYRRESKAEQMQSRA